MQTETTKRRFETKGSYSDCFEALGFELYIVKPGSKLQNDNKYHKLSLEQKTRTSIFKRNREISKRTELAPGDYTIMPCLFNKNRSMQYFLRIYYETDSKKQLAPVPAPSQPELNNKKNPKIFLSFHCEHLPCL